MSGKTNAPGYSTNEVPQFVKYTEEQRLHIKYNLEKSLGPEYVSFRAAAGGSQVVYIEGWKALNLANQIFGFNGWSSEVRSTQVDYVDHIAGKWSLGLSSVVRVTLKDGTFHEDIGYGNIENCKSRAMAFDKAKKEAVTDGIKRALRQFGNVLGNCLYEKNYLHKVKQVKKLERTTTDDQLLRPEENIKPQFDRHGLLVKETTTLVETTRLPTRPLAPANHPNEQLELSPSHGKIIPEDSYMEDSFLFSDEVFEEDGDGIADHEMELLLDKNTKSPPQCTTRTPDPSRNIKKSTSAETTNVAFVSTRLAREFIESSSANSPIPANEQIAFNAQVRTPLHNKNILDPTKSAPTKRTPLTLRKVIYESSKKPLTEDLEDVVAAQPPPPHTQHGSQDVPLSTRNRSKTPAINAPNQQKPPLLPRTPTPVLLLLLESSSRPLAPILNQNNNANKYLSFDDPTVAQKRTIGMPPGKHAPNKRVHRTETSQ